MLLKTLFWANVLDRKGRQDLALDVIYKDFDDAIWADRHAGNLGKSVNEVFDHSIIKRVSTLVLVGCLTASLPVKRHVPNREILLDLLRSRHEYTPDLFIGLE